MGSSETQEYLQQNVVPTIQEGLESLLNVWEAHEQNTKIALKNKENPPLPINPINFLASYLYRHNPKKKGAQSKAELLAKRRAEIAALRRPKMEEEQTEEEVVNDDEFDTEKLQKLLMDIFVDADEDDNGSLDYLEFKKVLEASELGLQDRDIRRLMLEVDVDENGLIDYGEFVPVALDLMQTLTAKQKAEESLDRAAQFAENQLLHGMTESELQTTIANIFSTFDTDKSGSLSPPQFVRCLNDTSLGLTKQEINAILFESDRNHDGKIDYEEFVPICFKILTELLTKEVLLIPHDAGAIANYLSSEAAKHDPDESGHVTPEVFRNVILSANLGVTRTQSFVILSEAPLHEGQLDYRGFSALAARMITNLYDPKLTKQRADIISKCETDEDWTRANIGRKDEMLQQLKEQFLSHDIDGNGVLDREEFAQLLVDADLQFTDDEISLLIMAADEDESGQIDYYEFLNFGFDCLFAFRREQVLSTQIAEEDANPEEEVAEEEES